MRTEPEIVLPSRQTDRDQAELVVATGELTRDGLYDDFDGAGSLQGGAGRPLAEAGALSRWLWSGEGTVVEEGPSASARAAADSAATTGPRPPRRKVGSRPDGPNHVLELRLDAADRDFVATELALPRVINLTDVSSFSADITVPADVTADHFTAGLQLAGTIVPQIGDRYWFAALYLSVSDGRAEIVAKWRNMASGEHPAASMPAALGTTYRLGLEVVPLGDGRFQLRCLVDGKLLLEGVPDEAALLLDPDQWEWGPTRQLYIWSDSGSGEVVARFDTVHASYPQLVVAPPPAPLYDDFDGRGGEQSDRTQLAAAGGLSEWLWRDAASVVDDPDLDPSGGPRGHVAKIVLQQGDVDGSWLGLTSPPDAGKLPMGSFSADVLLPSTTTAPDFHAGLSIGGWLVTTSGERWWSAYMVAAYFADDQEAIWCGWDDPATGERRSTWLPGVADRWLALRIDLRDAGDGRPQLGFYLDGYLVNAVVLDGGEALLDPATMPDGLLRSLYVHGSGTAEAWAYFDAVRAEYTRYRVVGNQARLYDNFDGEGGYRATDGSHLAVAGALSTDLWSGAGVVGDSADYVDEGLASGDALVVDATSGASLVLANPQPLAIGEVATFSADALVPGSAGTRDLTANLSVTAGLREAPDTYWRASIELSVGQDGEPWIAAGWEDVGIDTGDGSSISVRADTWYELRIDVARAGSDVRIEFLVDDRVIASVVPANSSWLADASRLEWGPQREIQGWQRSETASGSLLLDNVRAVYRRISLLSVQPAEAAQGDRVPVTLRGAGFRDGLTPYTTAWGVSFADIVVVDPNTVSATAIVDQLAESGPRALLVALPPAVHSNDVTFTVLENQGSSPPEVIFGLYDDFDGHGAHQREGDELAIAGALSRQLWHGEGEVISFGQGHGNVLRMTSASDETRLELTTPYSAPGPMVRSLEADVFLDPGQTDAQIETRLVVSGFLVDTPHRWWDASLVLAADTNGRRVRFSTQHPATGESVGGESGVAPEGWIELRLALEPEGDDSLAAAFYADGRLIGRVVLRGGDRLVRPGGVQSGLYRALELSAPEGTAGAHVLVDNVNASYSTRVPNQAPLFDDFEGNGDRFARYHAHVVDASGYLGNPEGHGRVLMFDSDDPLPVADLGGGVHWADFGTFSMDVLVSSETTALNAWLQLDNHTIVPEQPGSRSWTCHPEVRTWNGRLIYTLGGMNHNNSNSFGMLGQDLDFDTWYNLRFDIVPESEVDFRADLYVDDLLKARTYALDGGVVLNPSSPLDPSGQAARPFWRRLNFFLGSEETGKAVIFVDNVRAVP